MHDDIVETPVTEEPSTLGQIIAGEAYHSFADSGFQPAVSEEEIDVEVARIKQGDPNWHRTSRAERQMQRYRIHQQLQQQAAARERAKKLEAWRKDPAHMRFQMDEIVETGKRAGTPLYQHRTVLALRHAIKAAGYNLGLV